MVRLGPGGRIEGRLLEHGQPAGAGFTVLLWFQGLRRGHADGLPRVAGTDGAGRFRFERLAPGLYSYEVVPAAEGRDLLGGLRDYAGSFPYEKGLAFDLLSLSEGETLELAVDLEVGVVERFCESVVASGEPVGGAARVGVEDDDDARKRRARRVFGGVVGGG